MTRHISRDQTIAGISVLEVRRVFRTVGHLPLTKKDLAERLPDLSRAAIDLLWAALANEGYISRRRPELGPQRLCWMLTDKGWDLMCATGALPITRRTADRLLATTLDRADMMRAERTRWAYTPARIYVYGSYLTDKERLGDLDVAVEWEPRFADHDEQWKFREQLAEEAQAAGRRFPHYSAYLEWGLTQAQMFLRNRARGLSINTMEAPERREHLIYRVPHRLVYDHGKRL